MSEPYDQEREASPETFPDWLDQIQGEYLHLTQLYEKEREYGQKLAELMARVQHEIGFPIPLNPIVLSAALPDVIEAHLGEGAVISYVDPAGNQGTRPLTLMPLETIIFTVHECTFRLKELVAEKRRLMAMRVRALERVNLELDRATETLKYSDPDSAPELEKVEEKSSELAGVNLELERATEILDDSQPDSAPELEKVEEKPSELDALSRSPEKTSEPAEAPVPGFEFRGSFRDRRRALDAKEWGPE